MSKAIISLKINRINSNTSVDSISSLSLLVYNLGEVNSSMEFKRIIVLQEDYLVSEERIEEMKVHINEISEEAKSSKTSRVYSENLKGHLESILGNLEDIYVVSGFSDLQDQIDLMIIINDLFGSYKVRVFNTLFGGDKKTDFSFCQSNIEKFLEYIA
jgi:hypothetical protein